MIIISNTYPIKTHLLNVNQSIYNKQIINIIIKKSKVINSLKLQFYNKTYKILIKDKTISKLSREIHLIKKNLVIKIFNNKIIIMIKEI